MSNSIEKVSHAASPVRCQGTGAHGQCWNTVVEGSDYCLHHGGQNVAARAKKQALRNYLISASPELIAAKAHDNQAIYDLKEEIAMLRRMFEMIWNRAGGDEGKLLLSVGPLMNLIGKIESLISTSVNVTMKFGKIFTEDQLMAEAMRVMEIIKTHVTDSEVVAAIAEEIMNGQPTSQSE